MKFKEYIKVGLKDVDAWSEVIIFSYPALLVGYLINSLSRNTMLPYIITVLTFILRSLAGVFFFYGEVAIGVLFTILGFLFDDVDGQISRSIFGKDPQIRGTLDFLFDFISMGIVFVGIGNLLFLNHQDQIIMYLVYLSSFIFFMALTSTKFRLYSLEGISPDKTLLETGRLDGSIANLVQRIQKQFARLHMVMHPSVVDSLVVLFIIYPLSGFNNYVLLLSIVFIWVDLIISGVVPIYFLLKNG